MAHSVEEDMYEELNETVEVVDTQAIVKKVTRRVAGATSQRVKAGQTCRSSSSERFAAKLG